MSSGISNIDDSSSSPQFNFISSTNRRSGDGGVGNGDDDGNDHDVADVGGDTQSLPGRGRQSFIHTMVNSTSMLFLPSETTTTTTTMTRNRRNSSNNDNLQSSANYFGNTHSTKSLLLGSSRQFIMTNNNTSTTSLMTTTMNHLYNSSSVNDDGHHDNRHAGSNIGNDHRMDALTAMNQIRNSIFGGTDDRRSNNDDRNYNIVSDNNERDERMNLSNLDRNSTRRRSKLIYVTKRRSSSISTSSTRHSMVTTAPTMMNEIPALPTTENETRTTTDSQEAEKQTQYNNDEISDRSTKTSSLSLQTCMCNVLGQLPAVLLIGIFHLMIGIPFGVSYFPVEWGSADDTAEEGTNQIIHHDDNQDTSFPLPAKETVGIRMFLFATIVGQLTFTFGSGFENPIGLQMVENIGFTKELSNIVISHVGYGVDALATLTVIFGLSSILVGSVFLLLGKLKWGSVVHFFPTHVLIGCIGGIGLLICRTGLEVTVAESFSIASMVQNWNLVAVVVLLEIILRLLEWTLRMPNGQPRFPLLSPIYFCLITPMFYLVLWICRIPISDASDAGFFFPPLDKAGFDPENDITDENFGTPWDIWKVVFVGRVCWAAVLDALPTMLALVLFSLIHVPINIPALSMTTKVDVEMNEELTAHGYANIFSGILGGLQTYLAYTQSVVYFKSGGKGRASGLAVAAITTLLFFVGPTICSFLPRSMAGTLLTHVGIDLFLEGVWDSVGRFDVVEYSGVWLIVIVMTFGGMEKAMIAGFLAAVSTYVVQNVAYLSPIRGFMPATTLRSSHWNRSLEANRILNDSKTGRNRILVVQLQGHIFFANTANLTDTVYGLIDDSVHESSQSAENLPPIVLIVDFSLVLSIDSSAAAAIVKMKHAILKKCEVQLCLWVTGNDSGFPTEFKLSSQLNDPIDKCTDGSTLPTSEATTLLEKPPRPDINPILAQYTGSRVCNSLDIALMEAEDALLAKADPTILNEESNSPSLNNSTIEDNSDPDLSPDDESDEFLATIREVSAVPVNDDDAHLLFSLLYRETYSRDEFVWRQDDLSDCLKFVIYGTLLSELENEAGTTEIVVRRNIIGELGLLNGDTRMSSIRCISQMAIVYSMSRESFNILVETNPRVARIIDLTCIKFLALRVQHVSNRIFETRCLPV